MKKRLQLNILWGIQYKRNQFAGWLLQREICKSLCRIGSVVLLLLGGCIHMQAQNVDLETITETKPFKVNGGIAANGVYYTSNTAAGREPFTYYIQGFLNASYYLFSMPVSYSISNQGEQLDYDVPYKFNRLSLHPKYKWIQAHIGDANMTFSPYTLSGFQFTGGGLELTPRGGFSLSAMGGRLLKATEDDGDPRTIPAYKRMGYGAKLGYVHDQLTIGAIAFYAKDDLNSISTIPDEKGVTPKENLVVSVEGGYTFFKDLQFKGEYASTAITQDIRGTVIETSKGLAGLFLDTKTSTEFYNAMRGELNYSFNKSKVGVSYERIDPGYETLGAYFFNNDFENITLNTSTVLLKDKVNLAFNIGYQRDDLESQKESATSRTVGSVNATWSASERLNLSGSYSNFTTFTNIKPNQFDDINDGDLTDEVTEALDFRQLSQNANLNINYIISKTKQLQQSININYALADVANEQNGIVRLGDASTFHNMMVAYTRGYPDWGLNINTAVNATYNTIGREDALTWGPTLGISKKFLDNKMNTSLASSYNSTKGMDTQSSVTNIRANINYIYQQQHNFNLSAIQLFKSVDSENTSELTVTFGYNYNFDLSVKKIKIPKREKINDRNTKEKKKSLSENEDKDPKNNNKEKGFRFSYKGHEFEGEHSKIYREVLAIGTSDKFDEIRKIDGIQEKTTALRKVVYTSVRKSHKVFKEACIDYLSYLHDHTDFLESYQKLAFSSLKRLYQDAEKMNLIVKDEFIQQQVKVNMANEKNEPVTEVMREDLALKERGYIAHNWMRTQLKTITFDDIVSDKGMLKEFKNLYISKVFAMNMQEKTKEEIEAYLEMNFADFYHKKSLEVLDL